MAEARFIRARGRHAAYNRPAANLIGVVMASAKPEPDSDQTRPSERSSADLGWAPIAAAAGSPSLKRTIVGIEAIP